MADKSGVTLRINLNADEVEALKSVSKSNERSMGGEVTYRIKEFLRSRDIAPIRKEAQNE